MITLDDYLMERQFTHSTEFTEAIEQSAWNLLEKVNLLMKYLGFLNPVVSSGWRPPSINTQIGGAIKSNHMTGHAIDIMDTNGKIKARITKELLQAHQLYMEDPRHTETWVHLQDVAPRSGNRIFIP